MKLIYNMLLIAIKMMSAFFFNQNKDGLSVFCYAKNITIKVTVDQVNEEIVFENGRRAEFSDMSIEEMKGHINTFFGK